MTVTQSALKPSSATSTVAPCKPDQHLMVRVKTERYPSYTTTVLRCSQCRLEIENVVTPAMEPGDVFRVLHSFTTEYIAEDEQPKTLD